MRGMPLAILLALHAAVAYGQNRVSIVVGPFQPVGIERRQADRVAEDLREYLASKKLFRVFTAGEMDGPGAGDPLGLARRLEADKAVVGSLERSDGRLVLKVRLVDVESGRAEVEESVFFAEGRGKFEESAARLGDWLADSLPLVVAVTSRTGDTVVLDAGRGQGLTPGRLLRLLRGSPLGPADATHPVHLVPGLDMELVRVTGGEFTMGDIFCLVAPKEGAFPHRVRVSDFYLGRTEVTQGQWAAVMSGAFPSAGIVEIVEAGGEESKGRVVGGDPRPGDVAEVWSAVRSRGRAAEANPSEATGSDLPVTNVSWVQVQEFLLRLNKLTGARYRLPTEAEWEFASRSGGRPDFWAGSHDGEGEGGEAAPWEILPSPAGAGAPNAVGLHGLSRGPREWCADRWSEWYYEESPRLDPPGPEKSFSTVTGMRGERVRWEAKQKVRVVRGGITTRRGRAEEDKPSPAIGFRLALSAEPAGPELPTAVPVTVPVQADPSLAAGNLPPADFVEPVTGMEFVFVPEGSFRTAQGPVIVSPFYIGRTEVTQEQWLALFDTNPAFFAGKGLPVEQVSWEEAREYAARLSGKTGKTFRLPTEAEWLFAAAEAGNSGAAEEEVLVQGWLRPNSSETTRLVGRRKANSRGLFDMRGNVFEWTADWAREGGGWEEGARRNPKGPATGKHRLLRGGSWGSRPQQTWCLYPPGERSPLAGFRLVLEAPPPAAAPPTPAGEARGLDFVLVRGGRFLRGSYGSRVLDRGYLGLNLQRTFSEGVVIGSVNPEGPCAGLDLAPGDRIVKVDGARIDSYEQLERFMVDSTMPGMEIELLVRRGKLTRPVKVTLATRPGDEGPFPCELDDFFLGVHEVTQSQWEAVMGANPSFFLGPDRPVENISPQEAEEFIRRLNERSDGSYRLPTEAEWEFAARSGGKSERWPGTSRREEVPQFAWVSENAGGETHPVGRNRPNGLGLHDMAGNVAELVGDWFEIDMTYLQKSGILNPKGPPPRHFPGAAKVVRGGNWFAEPVRNDSRSAIGVRERKSGLVGLRLAAGRRPDPAVQAELPGPLRFRSLTGPEEPAERRRVEGAEGDGEMAPPGPPDYIDPATGMEFVLVKGGTFERGDRTGFGKKDERPLRPVTVGSFYIGRYEVTQAEWERVQGKNPSFTKDPRRPVESFRWEEMLDFIEKIGRLSGKPYRLPTEAEWEYAASGGGSDVWAGTSGEEELGAYAWFFQNRFTGAKPCVGPGSGPNLHSLAADEGCSQPVGTKKPNRFGLCDMSGNVREWVRDRYDPSYYVRAPERDPQGPESGEKRSVRGGDYYGGPAQVRASAREGTSPVSSYSARFYGFRLAFPAGK